MSRRKSTFFVRFCILMVVFSTSGFAAQQDSRSENQGVGGNQVAGIDTAIYVYRSYFNESPAETQGTWAQSRKAGEGGAFIVKDYDPNELSKTTSTREYNKEGIPERFESVFSGKKNWIEFNEQQTTIMWNDKKTTIEIRREELAKPHLVWFWRVVPDVGTKVNVKSISKNTGELNPIKEYWYVRDEVLKVAGQKMSCHLVQETREGNSNVNDSYWYDQNGMMVKHVHDVAGELRTSILVKKVSQAGLCRLPVLRDEIAERIKRDQTARYALVDSAKNSQGNEASELFSNMQTVDKENTAWLKQKVEEHGWLGRTAVGEDGAHDAWMLVQHADESLNFQKNCLELMTAMPAGEVSPVDIAYLTDRILTAEGKPQRYGTQCSMMNGKVEVKNVEDPENLNKRRADLGLPTIEEYLDEIKETYLPNKTDSDRPSLDSGLGKH